MCTSLYFSTVLLGVQNETAPAEAFTVYSFAQDINDEDVTLTYNGSIVNTGSNMLVDLGIYVCPADGVYAFQSTIASDSLRSARLGLIRVGLDYAEVFFNEVVAEYNGIVQAGITVAFECLKEERVQLRTIFSNSFEIYGTNTTRLNTYTGFRVCKFMRKMS